ncbi:hypothetical protein NC653_037768 [Populus alba x Populus x berolinensis]|uniref:Uncharacterized protein n=1 Tax=Populus alba x Populus x berolinensis TaxID=444605 RepID=A0AAD6LFC6_9ROSI|nr:hypothetical protein NC653_037768 [Populus alba x Populus x berolinensis]
MEDIAYLPFFLITQGVRSELEDIAPTAAHLDDEPESSSHIAPPLLYRRCMQPCHPHDRRLSLMSIFTLQLRKIPSCLIIIFPLLELPVLTVCSLAEMRLHCILHNRKIQVEASHKDISMGKENPGKNRSLSNNLGDTDVDLSRCGTLMWDDGSAATCFCIKYRENMEKIKPEANDENGDKYPGQFKQFQN